MPNGLRLRIGVLVNPYAGIGGSVGLKGSDGQVIRDKALAMGAELKAISRMQRTLSKLIPFSDQVDFFCFSHEMGEESVRAAGFVPQVVGSAQTIPSTSNDTIHAIEKLISYQLDLLLFAGGDGTARLLVDSVPKNQLVLGVPAGVKIHSGVYAYSPEAAGDILLQILGKKLVSSVTRDVKDINEDAFRLGQVKVKYYGELTVPEANDLLQQVKNSGSEKNAQAQLDVAQTLIEQLDQDTLYLVGTGSTTHLFLQELGLEGSLLGVDLLLNSQLIAKDVSANELMQAINSHQSAVKIIVTAIGGQGHIFGRGNQQFTPDVIRCVGKSNLILAVARDKLLSLNGRPLLVDTHDPELDYLLSGLYPVVVGYQDTVLYQVGY